MKFSNAYRGIKKIYVAEILGIIAAVVSAIAGVFAAMTVGTASVGLPLSTLAVGSLTVILGAGAGVLTIIAFFINIVGVNSAAKDEEKFQTALYCIIIGLVASVIGTLFFYSSVVGSITDLIQEITKLGATVFIISGIMTLADRLNNGAVSAMGTRILKMIFAVYCLILIADVIILFAPVLAGTLTIVASVLNIVQYIMYLIYLSRAKQMLS